MPEKPVVGGTRQSAVITAVHLHADPLHPEETEGVVLAWVPHKDKYAVWTVDMDNNPSDDRYFGGIEGALFVYSQLVASRLHGFANVPFSASFEQRPEEN